MAGPNLLLFASFHTVEGQDDAWVQKRLCQTEGKSAALPNALG